MFYDLPWSMVWPGHPHIRHEDGLVGLFSYELSLRYLDDCQSNRSPPRLEAAHTAFTAAGAVGWQGRF